MKIIPETMGIHLYVVVGISHDENTCTTVSFHQRREVGALGTYNIADTRHVLLKYLYTYIYIYTTSEKLVHDQSYGVLDRSVITILYTFDYTLKKPLGETKSLSFNKVFYS